MQIIPTTSPLSSLPSSVAFIRHSRLAPPFDQYDHLDYDQLCQLAAREVQPPLNPHSRALVGELVPAPVLAGVQTIVHSPAPRAVETAALIATVANRPVPMVEESGLREISFDLRHLLTKEEFDDHGMPLVRERVFGGMLTGEYVESLVSQFDRIRQLYRQYDLHRKAGGTDGLWLFVTHSFFMRAIQLYIQHDGRLDHLTTADLLHAENYSYLCGFFVQA